MFGTPNKLIIDKKGIYMNIASAIGKCIDQPLVVAKCSKAMPAVLCGGAALYAYKDIKHSPDDKKKATIKTLAALTGTITAALIATRGFKPLQKVFKNFEGLSPKYDIKEIVDENSKIITDFLKKNQVSKKAEDILAKAKTKILNPEEIKKLFTELKPKKEGAEFLEKLIPPPESATASKIRSEIGRLSMLGLVPVVGGITGGIVGDRLTEKDWKKRIPNKIKEGSYQYLANIFLCNVGAGVALGIMEKMKVKSKTTRALGMIGGIITFGVVGGSAIANIVGKKIIDPLLGIKNKNTGKIYDERKPEALDIGLHVDDIATVSVLSGLRWIEPALPILYSISGYRAGIGYRNGEHKETPLVHTRSYHHDTILEGLSLGEKLNLGHNFSKETFKSFS